MKWKERFNMLESKFWPKADIDTAVQFYLPILKEIDALSAFIRLGDSDWELDEPPGYKSPGDRLQLTVFIQDELISALEAEKRLNVGENLWGRNRSVFIRYPISVPFTESIQTLEQAIYVFIQPDKDQRIYPNLIWL